MDRQQIINFLLAHREDLGEKLQNAPERWFFHEDKLPPAIRATIPPHELGILLAEDILDDSWYIID